MWTKERNGTIEGKRGFVCSSLRKYTCPLAGPQPPVYEYAIGQVPAKALRHFIVMANAGMEN